MKRIPLRGWGCLALLCALVAPAAWAGDGSAYRCDRSPIASGVLREWFMTNLKNALAHVDPAEREEALLKVATWARDENEKAAAGWALGTLYLQAGRDDEAAVNLQPLLEAKASPLSLVALAEARVGLARVAMRKGDYAGVSDLLQPISISDCPLIPAETNYLLADALLRLRRAPEAMAALDAAGNPPPADADYWLGARTELHCNADGPAACIDRIAERVRNIELDPAVADVFNALLAKAIRHPAAAAALDRARQQGLVDTQGKVVAQPNHNLSQPVPISRTAPRYPSEALRQGIEGKVWAEVAIGADGKVRDAQIVYARPRRVFDEVTLTALRDWTFEPKKVDGQPVESRGLQMITFAISRGRVSR